ncbi:sigma-70 family RNA polymerase sigma factor [Streptomyces syringium]|uniref:RNA polymerase sigma factor n=1 Tax=Streptomyces syringium TaxID=76729 RepID=UPI00341F8136
MRDVDPNSIGSPNGDLKLFDFKVVAVTSPETEIEVDSHSASLWPPEFVRDRLGMPLGVSGRKPVRNVGSAKRTDFAQFYRDEFAAVSLFVMRQGADGNEAREAAQAAFCEAFPKWLQIEYPKAWLRRVAHRAFLRRVDRWKKTSPVEAVPELLEEDGPLARVLERDEERRVQAALAALPMRQRQVMAWKLDGFSHEEIARELDMEAEAVRAAYARARTSLKKALLELGGES